MDREMTPLSAHSKVSTDHEIEKTTLQIQKSEIISIRLFI